MSLRCDHVCCRQPVTPVALHPTLVSQMGYSIHFVPSIAQAHINSMFNIISCLNEIKLIHISNKIAFIAYIPKQACKFEKPLIVTGRVCAVSCDYGPWVGPRLIRQQVLGAPDPRVSMQNCHECHVHPSLSTLIP